MRPVQMFNDDYLRQCERMSADEIVKFLENFRRIHAAKPAPSRLISIKIPEDLLFAFKARARLDCVPYQAQIKRLMKAWLLEQEGRY